MNTTSGGYLQRVFAWRWTAHDNQTSLLLDVAELERVWTEQQADLRAELDKDPDLTPEAPAQTELYPGLRQRGGRYDRTPPQLTLIADAFPPEADRTRLDLETGFELASPKALALRMGQVFLHRGRPKGLGPSDYGAQRELTVARSLTWTFFEKCRELPSAPVVWREKWGDAAVVLGFLLWARRLGRVGITLSGPQWAAVLGRGESTVWRWLQRLERAGFLIRCRRYKPGTNGRPVALTANWYAFGPAALRELEELERPESAVRRQRLKVRRRHLRALGRRRGVDLLRGYQWPSRAAFAAEACGAYLRAHARDRERYRRFLAGEPPTEIFGDARPDFTTATMPAFVFQLAEEETPTGAGPVEGPAPDVAGELVGGELIVLGFKDEEQEVIEQRGEALLEGTLDGGQVAPVVRRVVGAEEDGRRNVEPRVAGGAHEGAVVRPAPSIRVPAYVQRCANAQAGAVGVFSRRDRRGRVSEITISSKDGPPLERAERVGGLAPGASGTGPPMPPAPPRPQPEPDAGPLVGANPSLATALSEIKDPGLRAAALAMARAGGFVV